MREFAAGAALLGRGWRMLRGSPRLLLIGAVPAALSTLLVLAAFVVLGLVAGDLAAWMTPFADGWSAVWRQLLRALVVLVVFGVAALVAVVVFAALTLLIGGPFYEHIAETVDDDLGGPEGPGAPRSSAPVRFARGLRDSVLLVAVSLCCAAPLFVAGFVPVLGQTVVPVVAVCVGGWLLMLEMVGPACARRGMRLGDRHRMLRRHPKRALGLGVATYLACAVPLAAIVVFPVGFVGATLLAREVLGAPEDSPAGFRVPRNAPPRQ